MPKNSEKQQKDQDVADKEEDLKVQLLSILHPFAAGGYSAYKAPDDHGWSYGLRTGGGSALGAIAGAMGGHALMGGTGATAGNILGSMLGARAGHQSARQKMRESLLRESLLKGQTKESALMKLASSMPKNSKKQKKDQDEADGAEDLTVQTLSMLSPLLAGGYSAYKAPDDHGWSYGLRTGGGATIGSIAGALGGHALMGGFGGTAGGLLGGMYGARAGHQSARQKMRESLLKGQTKESALMKLAARLKPKCLHCGVKHAAEGCSSNSQRSEPMKPAVRREPVASYPPAKQAGLLQQGARQISTLASNPGLIGKGATRLYGKAGGGLAGAGAVARHYAPGAAMVAAPIAAGYMLGSSGSPQQDQMRMASVSAGVEVSALRDKIAFLPALGAAAGAIAPHVARLGATAGGRYLAGKAVPMAMNAGFGAVMTPGGVGNKMRAAGAGALTGALPGSGIGNVVGQMALAGPANRLMGVQG